MNTPEPKLQLIIFSVLILGVAAFFATSNTKTTDAVVAEVTPAAKANALAPAAGTPAETNQ